MTQLAIRRVIIFTTNFTAMRDFYRDKIGLALAGEEDGWADFDAGAIRLALHEARFEGSEGPHKIAFRAADVDAVRADLIARGVAMGKVVRFGRIALCDGQDPDGNWFQLSSRP